MRDLLIAVIVLGSLPFALRSPRIGVMVWIWLSVMSPHKLTFGFANDVRWVLIVSVAILIGLLLTRDLKWPPMTALNLALIAFFAWTGVTTVFAVNFDPSFDMWLRLMKTAIVALLIPALFRTREHLRELIWVIVLSVAYFGTKGGLWILLTGGANRVYGPPGTYIEDNNALAMALVMLIPIIRFLQVSEPRKYLRWACAAMMLFCSVSVLGSYSRGALLGVTAMGILLWWKGRNKLVILLAAAVLIPPIVSFMPQTWHERMDTIETYQQDRSANNRFNSWATMLNIAKAMPITGAGFDASSKELYLLYSPDPTFGYQAAHSIYFQALGEHGFVGLGLYLLLYFAYWRQAGALIRASIRRPDLAWAQDFALMTQVAIVGYLVGAAFLSLVNYDVPYYLIAVLVAIRALVDRELKAAPVGLVPNGSPAHAAGVGRAGLPRSGIS